MTLASDIAMDVTPWVLAVLVPALVLIVGRCVAEELRDLVIRRMLERDPRARGALVELNLTRHSRRARRRRARG